MPIVFLYPPYICYSRIANEALLRRIISDISAFISGVSLFIDFDKVKSVVVTVDPFDRVLNLPAEAIPDFVGDGQDSILADVACPAFVEVWMFSRRSANN